MGLQTAFFHHIVKRRTPAAEDQTRIQIQKCSGLVLIVAPSFQGPIDPGRGVGTAGNNTQLILIANARIKTQTRTLPQALIECRIGFERRRAGLSAIIALTPIICISATGDPNTPCLSRLRPQSSAKAYTQKGGLPNITLFSLNVQIELKLPRPVQGNVGKRTREPRVVPATRVSKVTAKAVASPFVGTRCRSGELREAISKWRIGVSVISDISRDRIQMLRTAID